MASVGLAELKARLSAFLKQVKAGQELLITERGVPVARIVPLPSASERNGRRERLAKEGLLHLGNGRVRDLLRNPPEGEQIGQGVLDALIAEREEGR